MTQVKEMTNPELNRKLAELMGYSIYHYDKDYEANCYYMLVVPDGDYSDIERKTEAEAWADAPDYCTDPAASLEVETKAIENFSAHAPEYVRNLVGVMGIDFSDRSLYDIARLLTATPRERAEAAYQTLSGE